MRLASGDFRTISGTCCWCFEPGNVEFFARRIATSASGARFLALLTLDSLPSRLTGPQRPFCLAPFRANNAAGLAVTFRAGYAE